MYDHQIKRYSIVEQRAVYRWFVVSAVFIISTMLLLAALIMVLRFDKAIPIHHDSDNRNIKQLEEQIAQVYAKQDFFEQMQMANKKQLVIFEQLARCIPEQVCLTQAHINIDHIRLSGVAYTYDALFVYQKALEHSLHISLTIGSMDNQQELIVFVLESTGTLTGV